MTTPSPTVFLIATGRLIAVELPLPSVASSSAAEGIIRETRRRTPSDLPSQAQVGQPSFAASHDAQGSQTAVVMLASHSAREPYHRHAPGPDWQHLFPPPQPLCTFGPSPPTRM